MLEEYVHEIEVECLPGLLPEAIVADISAVELGASFRVRDLALPEGVVAKTHGDVTLFAVVDPAAVKEDIPAEAGANEPEVIGEKEKAERAAAREAAKK